MKLFLASLFLAVTLGAVDRPSEPPVVGVRERIRAAFPPISTEEELGVVDDDYVLHAFYINNLDLVRTIVVPKYFYGEKHPEWVQPERAVFMSNQSFEQLLSRIDEINPVGRLLERGSTAIRVHLSANYRDEYEGAFVMRCSYETGIKWFLIAYVHQVSGKLERKHCVDSADSIYGVNEYIMWINGKEYWTHEAAFRAAVVGKSLKIEAAGPFKADLLDVDN